MLSPAENYGGSGRYVNYAAIAKVFTEVFRQVRISKLPVHFPKIGAGLGGGNWDIIEAIINDCDPRESCKEDLLGTVRQSKGILL